MVHGAARSLAKDMIDNGHLSGMSLAARLRADIRNNGYPKKVHHSSHSVQTCPDRSAAGTGRSHTH